MTKKLFKLCIFLLASLLFSGCGKNSKNSKTLKILCTTFPIYDWTVNVTKNVPDVEVYLLMDKGTDLHNFQPSVDDIIKISQSDFFIYNGGESDEWIEDVIKECPNKKLKAINLMKNLNQDELLDEEDDDDVDLMICYEFDGHLKQHKHHHHHEEIKDEHIWLSLHFAEDLVNIIEKNISSSSKISEEGKKILKTNAENYIAQISEIERDGFTLRRKDSRKIVVADRNPFVYLAKDFNMTIYAAFNGCSAETEASFETIVNLTEKLDECKAKYVYVTESSDKKIANTIIKNSAVLRKIKVLDSMQSINKKDIENGATYIGIMKKNIETLKSEFEK